MGTRTAAPTAEPALLSSDRNAPSDSPVVGAAGVAAGLAVGAADAPAPAVTVERLVALPFAAASRKGDGVMAAGGPSCAGCEASPEAGPGAATAGAKTKMVSEPWLLTSTSDCPP